MREKRNWSKKRGLRVYFAPEIEREWEIEREVREREREIESREARDSGREGEKKEREMREL